MSRRSRYAAAQARRRESEREADRAAKMVTQFAALGVLVAFVIVIAFILEGSSGIARFAGFFTAPVAGPLALWHVLALTIGAWTALWAWRRLRG